MQKKNEIIFIAKKMKEAPVVSVSLFGSAESGRALIESNTQTTTKSPKCHVKPGFPKQLSNIRQFRFSNKSKHFLLTRENYIGEIGCAMRIFSSTKPLSISHMGK